MVSWHTIAFTQKSNILNERNTITYIAGIQYFETLKNVRN